MKVMCDNDYSKMRLALEKNGVNPEDIEFIICNTKDSELDEDFKIIHQELHRSMMDMGIWDAFEKACEELGIVLTRRDEPEK